MPSLEHQITDLWGQITAATYRFLELVAEFDETEGWGGAGIMSCAHWLNVFCGIGIVAAREKVRVARAMRALPEISAAFRDGRVSYSKIRAMIRVATPENEDALLGIAIYGTAAHVERTVASFRRVERIEEAQRAAAVHRDRFLDIRYEEDQHVIIHARLPVEVGELVRTALERAMDLAEPDNEPTQRIHGDSAESPTDVERAVPQDRFPVGARRADAFRLIVEQFLAGQEQIAAGGSDRYQLVVHIDQQLLSNGDSDRPVLAETDDGTPIAVETARRLGCDGSLVGMVDDENGEPLNVGRKTRAISPALKRALRARDKGCRFPGCTHTRFTEGHHVEHWADGGETSLSNLITLCHFHHHQLHEGGFRIERTDDGAFVFRQPDGDALLAKLADGRRFRGSALAEINRQRGVEVRPDTIVTGWRGERMDYSLAMDALLRAREKIPPDRRLIA
jgi:hypothetical protein